MRWLVVLLFLSACTRALDTPTDQISCSTFTDESSCVAAGCVLEISCGCPGEPSFPGCTEKTETTPDGCPEGCAIADASCASITSADACNARSDCWALLTFDEMCNSEGCESHFASCHAGSPSCEATDTGKCIAGPETCDPGTQHAYGTSCPIGCVATSLCPEE